MVLKKDLELAFEIGNLRLIQRSWTRFLMPNCANLADHHLRVIWISLILARMEGAKDTEKIMKMALVHDLDESRSVDVDYVSRQFAERKSEKAIDETLKGSSLEEFIESWKEYSAKESIEAKIVKDADTLDVDIELQEFEAMGNSIKKDWQAHRKACFERLFTESARKFWLELQEANPHDWHLNGSNRLTAGDWKK